MQNCLFLMEFSNNFYSIFLIFRFFFLIFITTGIFPHLFILKHSTFFYDRTEIILFFLYIYIYKISYRLKFIIYLMIAYLFLKIIFYLPQEISSCKFNDFIKKFLFLILLYFYSMLWCSYHYIHWGLLFESFLYPTSWFILPIYNLITHMFSSFWKFHFYFILLRFILRIFIMFVPILHYYFTESKYSSSTGDRYRTDKCGNSSYWKTCLHRC